MSARSVAAKTLRRIEQQGAFANLVLNSELERTELDARERAFATQLVYGTTRMRRACDHLVDRFVHREVDADVRTLLRLGAYQLHWLSTPDHAAVSATVELAPRKVRGFVNAVLRRVADAGAPASWPRAAIELSYPDWIVERLSADLGETDAFDALRHMNLEPSVHERADGYIQDQASQWVCELVDPQPGERVLDCCAAPGGKATLLAAKGATVVASDRRASRAKLVARNAGQTGGHVAVAVADARQLPHAHASFDRVLVDAPCSGLGVLRRRADARWRMTEDAVGRLQGLQREVLAHAADKVRVGGRLVYSVCTMTTAETAAVVDVVDDRFVAVDVAALDPRWRQGPSGAGLLLPQDHDTDGMSAFVWQRAR